MTRSLIVAPKQCSWRREREDFSFPGQGVGPVPPSVHSVPTARGTPGSRTSPELGDNLGSIQEGYDLKRTDNSSHCDNWPPCWHWCSPPDPLDVTGGVLLLVCLWPTSRNCCHVDLFFIWVRGHLPRGIGLITASTFTYSDIFFAFFKKGRIFIFYYLFLFIRVLRKIPIQVPSRSPPSVLSRFPPSLPSSNHQRG